MCAFLQVLRRFAPMPRLSAPHRRPTSRISTAAVLRRVAACLAAAGLLAAAPGAAQETPPAASSARTAAPADTLAPPPLAVGAAPSAPDAPRAPLPAPPSLQPMGWWASLFDVSVNAGVAATSRWFRTAGREGEPGAGPTVGASATYWVSPSVGVRLNAAYFRGSLPDVADPEGGSLRVHGFAYDLAAVYRPFVWTADAPWFASAYGFAGAGGLTTRVSGGEGEVPESGDPACVPAYQDEGICLRRRSTVPQLTAGVGADLVPLGRSTVLYAELGVHVYDAPAEVREVPVPLPDTALFSLAPLQQQQVHAGRAATARLTLGVKHAFGDILPAPPPPPPVPPPSPGGESVVWVRSSPPGAQVYLVPSAAIAITPGVMCRLSTGSTYYKGKTPPPPDSLRVTGGSQPYRLVVRLGAREVHIPLSMLAGETHPLPLVDLNQGTVQACLSPP